MKFEALRSGMIAAAALGGSAQLSRPAFSHPDGGPAATNLCVLIGDN